jgi:ankyrin repeat/BTB/POZ domain-containing protein 1
VFDAASRYLLFPLKRAVTDALLPQLETATPADLCGWLLLADKYVHSSTSIHISLCA